MLTNNELWSKLEATHSDKSLVTYTKVHIDVLKFELSNIETMQGVDDTAKKFATDGLNYDITWFTNKLEEYDERTV